MTDEFAQFQESISNVVNLTKSDKKKRKGLRGKKKLMAIAMAEAFGIVSKAVKQVGITRETHYKWMKEDPQYKEAIESVDDIVCDVIENSFIKLVLEGNPTATVHGLKTKLRKRGYGEHIITEEVGKKDQKITLEIINTNDSHKDNESLPDERGSSSQ